MSALNIFIIVLLSQVFFLSYYIPRKIGERMKYAIENLPPSIYPKLYGDNPGNLERSYKLITVFSIFMMLLGLAGVGYIALYWPEEDLESLTMIGFGYGMLQMLPIILMDVACLKQYKAMRESALSAKRRVNLQRKSIFNHTTPRALALVGFVALTAMIADMFFHDFDTSLGIDLYEGSLILLATNCFFAWVVRWRVYGKKLNPHQDANDEAKELDVVVKSAVTTSIALSVFMATMSGINTYQLDQFEPILLSIYLQAIVAMSIVYGLRHQDINKQNFDVYKADASH
jgi:hypothetical protein